MSWYRKNPLFAAVLTLCALIVVGELALTYERYTAWRGAEKKLRDQTGELQSMSSLVPPPTREVATAIEADLAKANASLASMQSELKGRGPTADRLRAAKVPAARTDAYFDLATFVEKMRDLAKKNEINIRPEAAHFGFAVYAKDPPEQERIEPVFRQRQVAQYLIESLLDAHPRAILAVKRERTLTKAEKEARAAAQANGEPPPDASTESEDGPDYFAIDPRVSAKVPGYIDTSAFRITFIGQTIALRTFLNKLATFELPVLVREVEVDSATPEEAASEPEEPAPVEAAPAPAPATAPSVVLSTEPGTEAPAPKPAPKPRAPTATPIVTKPLSKFTVTVEYIELVTPPPAPADGSAPAQPPSV